MSITMNENNFDAFHEKIREKEFPKSEFTGFDSIKGKPFAAYVHKTDRVMSEYVKFIELNSHMSDYELFVEARKRGYIQIFYYEYSRLERTGNNYMDFTKDKKVRRNVEKLIIKDLKSEFTKFKNELKEFEKKLNAVLK